jgi:hypothetical protein
MSRRVPTSHGSYYAKVCLCNLYMCVYVFEYLYTFVSNYVPSENIKYDHALNATRHSKSRISKTRHSKSRISKTRFVILRVWSHLMFSQGTENILWLIHNLKKRLAHTYHIIGIITYMYTFKDLL